MIRLARLGLLGRVSLTLAAVALLPLGVVPLLLGVNRDAMEDQVLRLHAVAARSAAERVAAVLQPLRALLSGAARNPLIGRDPRSPLARETLLALVQAQPTLLALAVVDPAGEEYIRAQSRSQAEAAERMLKDPRPAALAFARVDDVPYLRIEAPLENGAGAIRLVANLSALRELTRPEELGTDALLAAASERDGLIAAADGVSLDAFPTALLQAAGSGRISGAGRYLTRAGRSVLGAWAPVPGTDWFVVSAQPASVAEAAASRMKERSALALLLALGLAGAGSWAAWRAVVRPLRALAAAQRRLAMGPTRTVGGDEIEELGTAFALLERQVHDRDAVGQVFLGRYQVIEPIGSGGMGTVFKGWDPKLERHVALKTVHLGATLASGTRREQLHGLLHEALTVAKFNHRNIVAIYDLEEMGEAAFVAMELVDGTSLDRYLDRHGALPPAKVVPLAVGIARGLTAAHEKRVVHRDIKPANILLARDGTVKIADFGIAGALSAIAVQADMVFGTPGYLAPESIRGAGQTDKGDLFALGVILYECLTGSTPFPGSRASEILERTLSAPIASFRELHRSVPAEVAALVMGLLERDPERRLPASAWAVAETLGKLATANQWRFAPDIPPRQSFTALPARTFSMLLRRPDLERAARGAPPS